MFPVTTDQALTDLARRLGRVLARAGHKAGVALDTDDPRFARWLLLAAFEGPFPPAARSTPARLLGRWPPRDRTGSARMARGPAPAGRPGAR